VRASSDVLDDQLLLTRIAAESGVPFRRARGDVVEALSALPRSSG
jgi:hypothetical protein